MTGFARRAGGDARMAWTWELKSVNGRSLDLRMRLPAGFEDLEAIARRLIGAACQRGNLQVSLILQRGEAPVTLQVNRELLAQLKATVEEIRRDLDAAPPRVDGLLAVRGVLEVVEEEEDEAAQAERRRRLEKDLELALEELLAARRGEGSRLGQIIADHLYEIARLTEQAAALAAAQPDALRARLRSQIDEVLAVSPGLPEERLAQEVALLVTKSDVREELDRLRAHVEAAREMLAEGGAIGRRLDFLCQEFNRETNTLCAKSSDTDLTRTGLELKAVIDRLREQVQNIE